MVPAQVLPSPTGIWCRSPGTSFASSPAVASPSCSTAHGLGLELLQPALAVAGDARFLDQRDEALAFARDERIGARGLDDRHEIERYDEHRASHAQRTDEGAVVVQGALECGDGSGRRLHAGRHGQEHCRGIARVQADQISRELADVGYSRRAREMMPHAQAGPPFVVADPAHRRILSARPAGCERVAALVGEDVLAQLDEERVVVALVRIVAVVLRATARRTRSSE
jgi:hypothetical protein